MKARLDQLILDATTNVFVRPQHQGFEYSDGVEAEDKIYRILLEAKDKSLFSRELHDAITDWVTEYHFSEQRHNLLRHLSFESSDRILELGAGCGAITRQLGKSGAAVTAIEGSMSRARCAAMRCSDLPNVRVYCSDFQQVKFTKKFDFVTLIGVLEYCPMFFEKEDPFGACLELVKSVLKPGGKLIIALENRLGLKYFMGYSEDHTGIPYFGIQDLYTRKSARTVGREELRTTLIRSGFRSIEFQYPFPDYKIPTAVFTERAFRTEGFAPGEIIRQLRFRDYLTKVAPPFSENLVWPQLASNNLISALSNSFLVIASLECVTNEGQNPLLAVVYCLDRKREYKTETRFLLSHSDEIRVIKRPLLPKHAGRSRVIKLIAGESEYVEGTHLGSELMKRFLQNDLEGFVALCNSWVDYVRKHGLLEGANGSCKSLIKPGFIDCVPANLVLSGNKLKYIDREWHYYAGPYSLEMLIIRGLYQFQTMNSLDEFLVGSDSAFGKLVNSWLNTLGINLNKSLVDEFVEAECLICDEVYGKETWQPIRILRSRINEGGHTRFLKRLKRFIRKLIQRFCLRILGYLGSPAESL